MAWIRTGTVNLTNGSNVVTGVGSQFLVDGRIGDGFRGPDGRIYEVINIATNGALTIQPNYEGPTVNGGAYFLAPFEGYVKDTADALRAASLQIAQIPATKQDKNANLTAFSGLVGATDRLPYFTGAGALSLTVLTAKARLLLARADAAGMQAELSLVPVTSTSDTTAGRLLTPGYNGVGGPLLGVQGTPATIIARNAGATFSYLSAADKPGPAVADAALMTLGANADYAFQFACDWRTGAVYTQYKAGGALSGWIPQYNAVNSLLDPQTAGGLMSMTTVSGFTVFKYANGQMMVQGPIPTTPSIGANTQFTVSVAIPVTLMGFVTLVATLYPSVGNDFAIRNTQAPGTTAFIFCANGASAQTFSGNLTLLGRWK